MQIQTRISADDDSPEIFNNQLPWDEKIFPWQDLAVVEIDEVLNWKDTLMTSFSLNNMPKSLGIIADNDCTIDGDAIVFVREDARRNASARSVQSEALVPPFAVTPPASGRRSGDDAAGRQLLDLRPLVLALRI